MASAAELGLDVGGQPVALVAQLVGQVLVVQAGGGGRGGCIHPEIDHIRDDLRDRGDDRGAAWRAGDEAHLTVRIQDDRRGHRGEHPLAGGDGVGGALHEAELVRHAGLGGEVVHLVVEQEPRTFHRHDVPVERVDRGGHGDGIAGAVDDRIVRGVLPLDERLRDLLTRHRPQRRPHLVRRGRAIHRDLLPALSGVLVRAHARRRLRHEVGVGEVRVAIGVGALDGLRPDVRVIGREEAHRRQVVALEDVEDLRHRRAAGGGGRHRDDGMAAVVEDDGVPPNGVVRGHVGGGDQAAPALHLLLDEHRSAPAIEAVAPLGGDAPEGLGEVPLLEPIAHPRCLSVDQEGLRRGGVLAQPLLIRLQRLGQPFVDDDALREVHRRLDQIGPGQGAEALVRLPHPRHRAGYARGEMAHDGAVGHIPRRIEEHVAGGRGRRLLAEVERGGLPVRHPQHQEATTADVARFGVDHGEREVRRDGRVDRVTTSAQDLHPDLAGDAVGGRNHPALGANGRDRAFGEGPTRWHGERRLAGGGRSRECRRAGLRADLLLRGAAARGEHERREEERDRARESELVIPHDTSR